MNKHNQSITDAIKFFQQGDLKASKKIVNNIIKIDANNIAATAAYALFKKGDIDKKEVNKIYKDLGIDASKPNPWEV